MVLIGITHQKGGVGKSVICNILAQEAARKGNKVLIIDNDKQGSIYLEHCEAVSKGGTPSVDVIRAITFAEISRVLTMCATKYDLVYIDTAGLIDNELKTLVPILDVIVIPLTAGITDWSSLLTYLRVIKTLTDDEQAIIGILNKYKPNTLRWREFMEVLPQTCSENGIILPKMASVTGDGEVIAQLKDREDYNFLSMSPLSEARVNKTVKTEVINLSESIEQYYGTI